MAQGGPRQADRTLLQQAVSRGLISKDVAQDCWKRIKAGEGQAGDVLTATGQLTKEQLTSLQPIRPNQRLGGYIIIDVLGQGGMGQVYKAKQATMQREVALKVISPQLMSQGQSIARFMREAQTAGSISSPHVVTVHDVGQEDGHLFMALELVTGGDAKQLADREGGKLRERQATRIIADACRGLMAIHDVSLLHRDIKPANIFIDERGKAKLGDLGLARHESGEDKLTMTGTTIGTPAFMSPEQAMGSDQLDIRTDIYSLGASYYALLCGSPPFDGSNSLAVVNRVVNEPAPDPIALNPGLSDGCRAIILRCLAKDPGDRYADPTALLEDLERLAAGDRTAASLKKATALRHWPWLLAALLLFALIGAIVLSSHQTHEANTLDDDKNKDEAATAQIETQPKTPAHSQTPDRTNKPEPTHSAPIPEQAQAEQLAATLDLPRIRQLKEHWAASTWSTFWNDDQLASCRTHVEKKWQAWQRKESLRLDHDLQQLTALQLGFAKLDSAVAHSFTQVRLQAQLAGPAQIWRDLSAAASAPEQARTLWLDSSLLRHDGQHYRVVAPAKSEDWPGLPLVADNTHDLALRWSAPLLGALDHGKQEPAFAFFDGQLGSSLTERGSQDEIRLPHFPAIFKPLQVRPTLHGGTKPMALVACHLDGAALAHLLKTLSPAWPALRQQMQNLQTQARASGAPALERLLSRYHGVTALALHPGFPLPEWQLHLSRNTEFDRLLHAWLGSAIHDKPSQVQLGKQQIWAIKEDQHWRLSSKEHFLKQREFRRPRRPPRQGPFKGASSGFIMLDSPRLLGQILPLVQLSANANQPGLQRLAELLRIAQQHLGPVHLRLEAGTRGYVLRGEQLSSVLALAILSHFVGED